MQTSSQQLKRLSSIAISASAVLNFSCKPVNQSKVKGFAANSGDDVTNIAFIIGAPGSGKNLLKGVALDVKAYEKAFNRPEMKFKVIKNLDSDPIKGNFPTKTSELIDQLKQAAISVGQNGTLTIIFSGHGYQGTGDWSYAEKPLPLKSILTNLSHARNGRPIARGMIISDSCFSGNLIGNIGSMQLGDSSQSTPPLQQNIAQSSPALLGGFVIPSSESFCPQTGCRPGLSEDKNAKIARDQIAAAIDEVNIAEGLNLDQSTAVKKLFTQAIVIASSAPELTSLDYEGIGGLFSSSFLAQMTQMASSKKSATIRELLNATVASINNQTDAQKTLPSFGAAPDAVLDDFAFKDGSQKYDSESLRPTLPKKPDGTCTEVLQFGPWNSGFGLDANGNCINPGAYCGCDNTEINGKPSCVLLGPGMKAQYGVAPPILSSTDTDADAHCDQACDRLIGSFDGWSTFKRNCNGRMRLYHWIDGRARLEFYQYAMSNKGPVRASKYPGDPDSLSQTQSTTSNDAPFADLLNGLANFKITDDATILGIKSRVLDVTGLQKLGYNRTITLVQIMDKDSPYSFLIRDKATQRLIGSIRINSSGGCTPNDFSVNTDAVKAILAN